MSDMSACMLEGYGVLPSSPTHLRFSNPNPSFLILHWDPPAANGDSVIDYEVIAQKISPSLGSVQRFPHVSSPYILEGLESRATYEVYVEATNQHGTGQPSSRLVMRTVSVRQEEEEILGDSYSPGECCQSAGVSPDCLPLCTFDVTSSVLTNLTGSCGPELDKVVRCGAGGRDHLQCCSRRAVPPSCLPLCQAVHQQHTGADWVQCSQHLQQIFTCYEEGTASLPPPVTDLYAARVEDHGVSELQSLLTSLNLLSRYFSSGDRARARNRARDTIRSSTRRSLTTRPRTTSSRASSRSTPTSRW